MTNVVAGLMLAAIAASAAPVPKDAEERLAREIVASREKAIGYLKKQQNADGNWEGKTLVYLADMQGGMTSFVALSLLEGGVAADDPAIAKAVKYLVELPPRKTYVVSLQTQVLVRVDAKKHAEIIQRNVDWLQKQAKRRGDVILDGWSYPGNHLPDASNTHYAVYALHVADKAGAKIDPEIWDSIRWLYVSSALKSGLGWSYHTEPTYASQSMTAAALVGLIASGSLLKDSKQANEVLEKGWKAFSDAKGSPTKSEGYMLHLTAELGRLVGKPAFKVGEKSIPWYENGAAKLVKSQQADGSWKLGKGLDEVEVYCTAAALYFLGPPKK